MKTIIKNIIALSLIIMTTNVNAMEERTPGRRSRVEYSWNPPREPREFSCGVGDLTEQIMAQALEDMRLKKLKEEKQELEKRRAAYKNKKKTLNEIAGVASLEKLLAEPSDEERLEVLSTLPKDVINYFSILIEERKALLDKNDANDLIKEDALEDLNKLLKAYLGQ